MTMNTGIHQMTTAPVPIKRSATPSFERNAVGRLRKKCATSSPKAFQNPTNFFGKATTPRAKPTAIFATRRPNFTNPSRIRSPKRLNAAPTATSPRRIACPIDCRI